MLQLRALEGSTESPPREKGQPYKRALVRLEVPRCMRPAMVYTERVVSCRSRAAMASLAEPLLQ